MGDFDGCYINARYINARYFGVSGFGVGYFLTRVVLMCD